MVVARHVEAVQRALQPFWAVVTQPPVQDGQPMIADFMAGNPQEPTLPGFVEALQRWSVPPRPTGSPTVRCTSLRASQRRPR